MSTVREYIDSKDKESTVSNKKSTISVACDSQSECEHNQTHSYITTTVRATVTAQRQSGPQLQHSDSDLSEGLQRERQNTERDKVRAQ